MSLTSTMLVGFTGISSNSVAVDTIGDNLANVNTTAFKGQRTLFETQLYQTLSEGSGPSDLSGGTLPRQTGTGSAVSSIQRSFEQGILESTGFPSDLAIQGEGFFIVEAGNGDQVYTRNGAFHLDSANTLATADGAPLQVFLADANGNIDQSTLRNLVIALGTDSQAIATTTVEMDGQLDSGTNIASTAAVSASQPLVTAGGTPATASTRLVDLVDAAGLSLFADGDVVTVGGSRGGLSVMESSFMVGTTGSTLADFASHLEAVLGIETDPAAGGNPGVSIADGSDLPAGTLVIRSNVGQINAVELSGGSITNTTGIVPSPFSFTTTTPGTGGGIATTSFGVFDSLGEEVSVRLRTTLESKSESGTTWRFYAESADDSDLATALGIGTITFDTNGQFVAATGTDLVIDRAGTGSGSPLAFTLDFSGMTGLASVDGTSELIMASQDGAPSGTLIGYSVDRDGLVTGTYTNQHTEVLGQVALATFTNNEGLIALSDSTFTIGPNSGEANVIAPQDGVAGFIRSGQLELSNVEVAREFINLITASAGISSASRVVRVADDLLQELLLLAR